MHAIISIRPRYVRGIVAGTKTIEVRTKNVRLPQGTRLWIYSTLPVGEICAVARILSTYRLAPTRAWKEFQPHLGLTRSEFQSYVNGSTRVSLIRLGQVAVLSDPLSLQSIRRIQKGFQPPQFFRSVAQDEELYKLLWEASPRVFEGG